MELSLEYHPSELHRKIELSWLEFWNDQDFRHPELRHRLGLELSFRAKQTEVSPEIKGLIDPILEEFDRSEERVSVVEFWVLMEWNERYQQASTLLDIVLMRKDLDRVDPMLTDSIRERLDTIYQEMIENTLPNDPSWHQLLKSRWCQAALRDEVRYFRSLLI